MLDDVLDLLICPVCRGSFAALPDTVRCDRGHSFDIAKQGYVNLLTGSTRPGTADTPAMVAARDEFLTAGHYAPIAARLAELCAQLDAKTIGDAGAGTGYYLAAALPPGGVGLAMDVSKPALKRAARAHPRLGAVAADVWRPLPVRDGALDALLNVFAPRNPAEFARVLKPEGRLLVVTPGPGHLRPLVERLGLLRVEEEKEARLAATLAEWFVPDVREELAFDLRLGHRAVAAAIGMGPSAFHAITGRVDDLPDPITVQAAVLITTWRPRR